MSQSRTVENLRAIYDLLTKIQDNLSDKQPDSFLKGEKEDLRSLSTLRDLVGIAVGNDDPRMDIELREFLAKQWEQVANTERCYTRTVAYSPYKQACIALANYLSSDSHSANKILMPSVRNKKDSYDNRFDDLKLGQFILSDDKSRFISTNEVIENGYIAIMEGRDPKPETYSIHSGVAMPLSELESARFGIVSSCLDSIYKWYTKTVNHTMYDHLDELRVGLEKWNDKESNGQACSAIVKFMKAYLSLSERDRNHIRGLSTGLAKGVTLGSFLDKFLSLRVQEGTTSEYKICVGELQLYISEILKKYTLTLQSISVTTKANNADNLRNVINQLCAMLNGDGVVKPESESQSEAQIKLKKREMMGINGKKFSESQWCITYHQSGKIIVEGINNFGLFVGVYYPHVKAEVKSFLSSFLMRDSFGLFDEIRVIESTAYPERPSFDANNQIEIDPEGNIDLNFELRKSAIGGISYIVPRSNAEMMIEVIKKDAEEAKFASWVKPTVTLSDLVSMRTTGHFRLFKPYSEFGSRSWFGYGHHNQVTWCEEKLRMAGCGEYPTGQQGYKPVPINPVRWL